MSKTGQEIATDNMAAIASLSSEDVLKDLFNNATPQKEDVVAEKDKLDEPETTTENVVEEAVDTEKPVEKAQEKPELEETKEEDKAEVKEEKPEFELPGEENKPEVSSQEDVESTWKELAKTSLDVELAEDTYEAYTEAVKKAIETKTNSAKELAMEEAMKIVEEKLAKTPEAKMMLDFLNNKGTYDDFVRPTQEIEKLQALSDSELVAKDLELRGWEQDKIDAYIEDRIEKGKLDLDAYELRKILDTNKANITAERVAAQKEYIQKEEQRIKDAVQKDTTQIREALGKTKDFMDTPISDKHKDYVMKKYEKGEYHELFKNPDTVAEFLLFKEFGKQGIERLKTKSFQTGKETIAKKLHNVPPKSNVGGKRLETQVKSPIGNVEALGDLTDYR